MDEEKKIQGGIFSTETTYAFQLTCIGKSWTEEECDAFAHALTDYLRLEHPSVLFTGHTLEATLALMPERGGDVDA